MPGCASLAAEVASIHDLDTMSTQTATNKASNAVIEGLQTVLADSYALMAQTHLAHWMSRVQISFSFIPPSRASTRSFSGRSMKSPSGCARWTHFAIGGLKTLAKGSSIMELAVEPTPAKDFVAHLIESHEIVLGNAHALREAAGSADDLETQDLIIGRIQVHQKTLWMLKSFLRNL
jgi:starvation-inducible DNA-binding protein